jgi:DNA polymerase III delta subunit
MRSSRSYRDFQQQLAARKLDAGYIFAGSESYLIDEALTALRDAQLTDDFTNPDNLPREGDSVIVDSILAQALENGSQKSEVRSQNCSPLPTPHSLLVAETEEQEAKLSDARKVFEAFDYVTYQGREADMDSILMQIATPPFMARRRLVIVRDFGKFRKDDQERLLAELKKESPICRLALTLTSSEDWAAERLISSKGCGKYVIELPSSDFGELNTMIDRWAAAGKFTVAAGAKQLLLESTAGSLGRLKVELEKLKTLLCEPPATGHQPPIEVTKERVRDLTGIWREYHVSELVDTVSQRNRAAALNSLWRLADWNESPVMIVGWLAGRFMRMLSYGSGDARLWTKQEIVLCLRHLATIDLKLKRGFPEQYYLLENFVIRRTQPLRKTA